MKIHSNKTSEVSAPASSCLPPTANKIHRDHTAGTCKPEPLEHLGAGYCLRRLTQADRVVYRVLAERIDFLQALYHS